MALAVCCLLFGWGHGAVPDGVRTGLEGGGGELAGTAFAQEAALLALAGSAVAVSVDLSAATVGARWMVSHDWL